MSSHIINGHCILCASSELELVVPIRPSPIADSYLPADRGGAALEKFPLDLHLCRNCGHVQLRCIVNPEVLFGDYIYFTSSSAGLVEHFRRQSEELMARFGGDQSGLVVDIGSNDGTLLRFFKEAGHRVLGIDAAVNVAEKANAAGIETLAEFFTADLGTDIRREHGPAAIVTANNVFAHSLALPAMADGIRAMLAPDGVFLFEVSYLLDIVEKMLFDTVYHEHLCYHSVKPLQSFFARHGLELFDIQRIESKGGSLRGFVQLAGGPRKVEPMVAELVGMEEKLGLDQPALFAGFSDRIERAREALIELLETHRDAGRRVVGFGASATVTTLMHHFELGPYLECLVDDNQSRHGLVSPGYGLMVRSPELLQREVPDCTVILAWQYARPILKNHAGYLDKGGQFVVPLPELTTHRGNPPTA